MRTSVPIEDAIKLIREKGLLESWTDKQIHIVIDKAIKDYAFSYTLDENNKIDGIVFGKWLSPISFYVTCCIGKMKVFIDFLKYNFPSCEEIIAERNGTKIAYKL